VKNRIPEIAVEWVPIDGIKPNPANPRTHSRKQIKAIARSVSEFGWVLPILVDRNGVLVAGHARVAAARLLGLQEVPVVRLSHLRPEQIRAYMIADNRLAESAGWDRQMADLSFDLTLTGFESLEIEELFGDFRATVEPEDEYVPVDNTGPPVSRPGELFLLDKHRLLCGDATSAEDVAPLLSGAVPNLLLSDPPYGLNYDPAWRHRLGVNTSRRSKAIANDDRADWREAWQLFPGNVAYVWFAIGRGDYHWGHEPCWYAVRKGQSASWCGNRKQSTVWEIPNLVGEQDQVTAHATQKPVECMRRPIVNNTRPGDAVYDPFVGSGTTIIAAERTGRIAYGMDIDPRFVDVVIRRWQAYTGKDAILAGTDKTFDELAAERGAREDTRTIQPARGQRNPQVRRTCANREGAEKRTKI
jgi:hypothetical protein